jgi:3-keto-L-gulonate-6-phosphate decarboxylase
MVKLQLALDTWAAEHSFKVMDQVKDLIDYVELGNIGNSEGVNFIKTIKTKYPGIPIIWDQKSCSPYNCKPPIEAGTDYISIARCGEDVAQTVYKMAHAKGAKVIGDIVHEGWDGEKVFIFARTGCEQISFYPFISPEDNDTLPLKLVNLFKEKYGFETSVYGSLTVDNMKPVLELKPDIVVIGKAIFEAANPREATLKIKDLLAKY